MRVQVASGARLEGSSCAHATRLRGGLTFTVVCGEDAKDDGDTPKGAVVEATSVAPT